MNKRLPQELLAAVPEQAKLRGLPLSAGISANRWSEQCGASAGKRHFSIDGPAGRQHSIQSLMTYGATEFSHCLSSPRWPTSAVGSALLSTHLPVEFARLCRGLAAIVRLYPSHRNAKTPT